MGSTGAGGSVSGVSGESSPRSSGTGSVGSIGEYLLESGPGCVMPTTSPCLDQAPAMTTPEKCPPNRARAAVWGSRAPRNPYALDLDNAARLWDLSADLLNLTGRPALRRESRAAAP